MITDGERILGLDQKGVLYLIDGTPESLEILSQKKVSDTETWAHVAINNGNIYIRSLNKLMCYSMNQTSDSTETAVSAAAKLK